MRKIINKVLGLFNIKIVRIFPRYAVRASKKHFKNRPIIAIEIGVFEGKHALSMLKELNIEKQYLIDPWESYNESGKRIVILNKAFKLTLKRLFKYKDKIKIIKKFSKDAINDIPNADFIYIDGNHSYKFAKQDMKLYFKKVKQGGILAGHDIPHSEVAKAFHEFVSENKLDPHISGEDWWVFKK